MFKPHISQLQSLHLNPADVEPESEPLPFSMLLSKSIVVHSFHGTSHAPVHPCCEVPLTLLTLQLEKPPFVLHGQSSGLVLGLLAVHISPCERPQPRNLIFTWLSDL